MDETRKDRLLRHADYLGRQGRRSLADDLRGVLENEVETARFEYRVMVMHPAELETGDTLQNALNRLSSEFGWRFVAALPTAHAFAPIGSLFVFERPTGGSNGTS
jgi:hypothetical protein